MLLTFPFTHVSWALVLGLVPGDSSSRAVSKSSRFGFHILISIIFQTTSHVIARVRKLEKRETHPYQSNYTMAQLPFTISAQYPPQALLLDICEYSCLSINHPNESIEQKVNTVVTCIHYAMLALFFTLLLSFVLVFDTVIYFVAGTRNAAALLMNDFFRSGLMGMKMMASWRWK